MKLVLKNTSGETDVRLIASIHSWEFVAEYPHDTKVPHQIQWRYRGATGIVFIEDFLLRLNYLVVEGPDADTVKKQVVDGLEIYQFDEISRLATEGNESPEDCVLVSAAALMAPKDFDQRYFDFIVQALNSEQPDVQRAAIFSVNYAPWIEFREVLLNLKEKAPGIKRDVDVVVDAIDTHGWIK